MVEIIVHRNKNWIRHIMRGVDDELMKEVIEGKVEYKRKSGIDDFA